MRINPFQALRPTPDLAAEVASVPYDTVNTNEARALAAGNARSFLHVVRAEIDLPDGTDIHSDAVYEQSAATLRAFEADGTLIREAQPCLYLYRQTLGAHRQCGMVCCCHTADYADNVIRRHEKTRAEKEDDRTRLIGTLSANSGPVFLTYRDQAAIDALVAVATQGDPLFSFAAEDSVQHDVWRVDAPEELVQAFDAVPLSYVADGHHRAAAAARVARERRVAAGDPAEALASDWFLTVLFPAGQLRILPYNRCVTDLNGLSTSEFLKHVQTAFSVSTDADPTPTAPRRVSMYLEGTWYGLSWERNDVDPVAALDVSRLQDGVLNPILGIGDPRTDTRIEFVGGVRGTEELVQRVDSGAAAVAFSMYPVTVNQMMDIADADEIMPPKSTWFEPKLRSGLLTHTF